jgi:hypothetical protein
MNSENLFDGNNSETNEQGKKIKKPWSTPEITKGVSFAEVTQAGSEIAGVKVGSIFVTTAADEPQPLPPF